MKHAYLIAAHNQFELLKKLVTMLDYSNNDIYIHIDKKVSDVVFYNLHLSTAKAQLFFTDRNSVTWGDYSQIKTEMTLLNEATKSYHDYYHFLSGVDLPIKSHSEIDEFFQKNYGLEFVSFDKKACENRSFEGRCMYFHHYFQNPRLDGYFYRIQKILKINRIKKLDIQLMKGSNWFDITHEFAIFVCKKMSDTRFDHIFHYSHCGDEVFLPTILYNSSFFSKKAEDNIRFVDWSKQGKSPQIITQGHWQQIMESKKLFARKFDIDVDRTIIERVEAEYGNNA